MDTRPPFGSFWFLSKVAGQRVFNIYGTPDECERMRVAVEDFGHADKVKPFHTLDDARKYAEMNTRVDRRVFPELPSDCMSAADYMAAHATQPAPAADDTTRGGDAGGSNQ